MYVPVYRYRVQEDREIVCLVCSECCHIEQHPLAQGEAKRGKPCDQCRK